MLEKLRKISVFENLNENELKCFLNGTELWLNSGDILFHQGDPVEYFYVVFEGAIQLSREIGNQNIVLATYGTGTFFGEVPLLAGTLHLASGQAVRRSYMYCLHENDFWQMITICPTVRKIVLGHMACRMQELQLLSQQHEKLVALGTLSAGLAHELNNPVSAAHRAAGQLQDTVKSLDAVTLKFIEQYLTPTQVKHLLTFRQDAIEHAAYAATQNPCDPLVQIDWEDELAHWLELHNVTDGWKLAPALVAAGLNNDKLEAISKYLTTNTFTDVLIWLEATLSITGLLKVLEQGTTRVSEIVKAIKDYSYMDRASLLKIDVHEGLENTLTILRYKLRKHNIVVTREYEKSLPCIQAHGSALNQVWTNLIDNAIDALGEQGKIWVRTSKDKDYIIVEIVDNGPGIPPKIQSRIFEPFFTTKEVGAGTGLGLEISYRIVVTQHNGDIRCFSQPGQTRFQIRLPISPS
ncbi:MAG: cyclic nucleotide-binding domain-containing protein [Nostoc sp. NOS(2021)]|uniref:ATP-binding protein n=1 Tax=Nostoc sp. NOS(2021) TaxID=2815407 RepID=UPI0025E99233|nr:ATP-binding protein [Nostoc sp. NOS(2021)]MBN3896129.1 cyclic nucleotide-binding domain-containing protein [Nostoc sp. NOS(2021)]